MEFEFKKEIIYPQDPIYKDLLTDKFKNYYKTKYEICKEHKPKRIAEIGVRAGYSAWSFLQACPKAEYFGYDANNGQHGGEGGEDGSFALWADTILTSYKYSLEFVDTQGIEVLEISDIDFFHVDGDHSVEGVMHDLDLAYGAIKVGGVILVDDITFINDVRNGAARWMAENREKIRNEFRPSMRGEMLIYKEK